MNNELKSHLQQHLCWGAGMDAKTRDLALLAPLSLFCTGFAWSWGYVILGSVFFALGGVAALGIAERHWR
jgi:hypothetical protein